MTQHPHGVGPHPAEHDLADLLDDLLDTATREQVTAHVGACLVCEHVLHRAGAALPPGAPAATIGGAWPRLPEQVQHLLVERAVTDPAAGQVWRLRGRSGAEELAQLAVIVRAGEDLLVAPVTADEPPATDLWTVQLEWDTAKLPLAVWVSLSAVVGVEVLDVHLGTVDQDVLLRMHQALRRGDQPPRGLATGRLPDAELEAYRAQLAARMTALSESRLITAAEAAAPQEATEGDLVDALVAAGWNLIRVKQALGVTASQARQVLARERPLSDAEAARVQEALGVSAPAPVVTPPEGWVREVATPVRRRRFELVATSRGEDAWQFRAEQARAHAQMAARGHRDSDVDWAALVEQHLARLETDAGLAAGG